MARLVRCSDAIAEGRAVAALGRDPAGPVHAILVCRPAPALAALVPLRGPALDSLSERTLGADQSNSSSVIGETVLLKTYRRLEPELNPELELVAFLTEEAGFGAARAAG